MNYQHHCARLKFEDFWKSFPKFFFREGGWGPSAPKSGLLRAEGAQLSKNLENLEIVEKFLLKNAI